jgi:hypothetical protein
MKKSDVKKWVEALRSGDYQQGGGILCKEDEISDDYDYCCLGVACDIFVEGDWIQHKDWDVWSIGPYEDFSMPSHGDKKNWGRSDTASFPSLKILKKMGLDVAYAQELAELNDKGWSFKKIANKIEKDLL